MAFFRMIVESKSLGRDDYINVIVPSRVIQRLKEDRGRRFRTLWLIHVGGGDCYQWQERSRIIDYLEDRELIVVMPTIRSTHCRNIGRGDYPDYTAHELRDTVANLFPISLRREDNYICGGSFGGYFAIYTAMCYPEQFGGMISMCSPLDPIIDDYRTLSHGGHSPCRLEGPPESRRGTKLDLPWFVQQCWRDGIDLPRMYQTVGTEDMTYTGNLSFLQAVRETGYDHTWVQDGGWHDWEFWDSHICDVIDWMLDSPTRTQEGGIENGSD